MKRNQNGSIILVMLVAVVLIGVGALGYFVYQSRSNPSSGIATSNTNNAATCGTDECFQEKFVKCELGSLQQKAISSGGAKAYYEIVGGDTANCKMLYRTDSDNLDMICTYQDTGSYNTGDNTEFVLAAAKNETDAAFGKVTNCTGPKVEKLKQTKPVTNAQ